MSEHTAHATPKIVLFLVFFALVALTGITVWVAYVDLGAWSTPVAVGIATIKALLVVVIFMEMRFSEPLTWLAGATGILFLVLLIGLTRRRSPGLPPGCGADDPLHGSSLRRSCRCPRCPTGAPRTSRWRPRPSTRRSGRRCPARG
jgi:caa(3)-type oxidase subunit IV